MKTDTLAKKRLVLAFKELAKEKPLSKISVSDIAGKSQLSRQTFYANFIDKYDLACYMYSQEITDIVNTHNHDKNFQHLTTSVMKLMKKDLLLYKNLMKDIEGQNSFFSYWLSFNESYMKQHVGKMSPLLEMAITMYCYGSMMGIYCWLFHGAKESEEMVAELITQNMPEVLKAYYL